MQTLYAILLIILGVIFLAVTCDITMLVLAVMLGLPCLLRKKNRHYSERRGYK